MNTQEAIDSEYSVWVLVADPPYVADRQPAIVRYPDMAVDRTTLQFIRDRYVASGKRPSPHTWRACADALAGWLTFCTQMGIDFQHACTEDLIAYRDAYLNAISPQGKHYNPKTIATRIGYIQEFYGYLTEHDLYDGDIRVDGGPKRSTRSLDRTPNAHLRRGDAAVKTAPDIKPKARKQEPIRPLGRNEIRSLVDAANCSLAPQRNRAIVNLGWVCGLRREEIQGLKTIQFQNITTDTDTPAVQHAIVLEGKGHVVRKVPVPAWLIDEINSYIQNERTIAVYNGGLRHPSSLLFLGKTGSKTSGRPLSLSGISHIMETLCNDSGLVEVVERLYAESGKTYKLSRPKHSFHDLRHTYAVLTYYLEKQNGNSEPWKKIQSVLGHKSLSTTMDIYLNHVSAFDPGASVDYRGIL